MLPLSPSRGPPDASVAFEFELWTIPFAAAIERSRPEFTLWTFPSDLAVEPKPRAKLPLSPLELPDLDSSIEALLEADFSHGTIFPGA
jgi:hypothetical protein